MLARSMAGSSRRPAGSTVLISTCPRRRAGQEISTEGSGIAGPAVSPPSFDQFAGEAALTEVSFER
jgi:hypothetical protein